MKISDKTAQRKGLPSPQHHFNDWLWAILTFLASLLIFWPWSDRPELLSRNEDQRGKENGKQESCGYYRKLSNPKIGSVVGRPELGKEAFLSSGRLLEQVRYGNSKHQDPSSTAQRHKNTPDRSQNTNLFPHNKCFGLHTAVLESWFTILPVGRVNSTESSSQRSVISLE